MSTRVSNSGSGNWDAKSTWRGGVVPTAADDVFLDFLDPSRPNQTYQVDLLDHEAVVRSLTILEDNVLNIADDGALEVDQLYIAPTSALMGIGTVDMENSVENFGTIRVPLDSGASAPPTIKFVGAGSITNTGTMLVTGDRSALEIDIELDNAGTVRAQHGGTVFIQPSSGIEALSSSGFIEANDHGRVFITVPTQNDHGQLIADGGAISVIESITGGFAAILDNGELNFFPVTQESTTSVQFQGTGIFYLQNSANFSGSILGFGAGDWIDVLDVAYTPGKDSYDPSSGILTVGDGTHTTELQLIGGYDPGDFIFRESGTFPGTLVSFNSQASSAPPTIDHSDLQVASLYLGYFGRAADPEGLAYWHGQLAASPNAIAAIAASFSVQAEARTTSSLLADPQHATQAQISSFIDSLYENLFGRAPDAPGAAYWQNQLNASVGSPRGIGAFILNVINGAQAPDAATIANKSQAAAFFADHLGLVQLSYDAAADAAARTALDGITHDGSTVIAAEKAMSEFIDIKQLMQFTGVVTEP